MARRKNVFVPPPTPEPLQLIESPEDEVIRGEVVVGPEETLEFAWMILDDEPPMWYERFKTFYLPLGPSRNLLKAFMTYLEMCFPDQAMEYRRTGKHSSSPNWSRAASHFHWRERAAAFDQFHYGNAIATVEQAKANLLGMADEAVTTLRKALDNPRLQVAAAKEILDRAGLPATTIHEHKVSPYTADDYAKARQEVIQWQEQMRQSTPELNG